MVGCVEESPLVGEPLGVGGNGCGSVSSGLMDEPHRISWYVCHVPTSVSARSFTVIVQFPRPDSPLQKEVSSVGGRAGQTSV